MRDEVLRATLRVTKALSDLQRVRILMMLQDGELCVCRIVGVLELAASTVSKHLSILSEADLVEVRKDGRWAYYRLPQGKAGASARPVLKWLRESLAGDETIEKDLQKLRRVLSCDPESLCRAQRTRS